MPDFRSYLGGKDLRSIAGVAELIPLIKTQADFDALFSLMLTDDRLLVMRSADAIEKITREYPDYLDAHVSSLLNVLVTARDIELKWHVAVLVTRVHLNHADLTRVWRILTAWAQSESESKIVRVNALQALFDLSAEHPEMRNACQQIFQVVKQEGVPSINARIRKLYRR